MGSLAILPPHLLYFNRQRSTSQDSNNFYRLIPSPPLGFHKNLFTIYLNVYFFKLKIKMIVLGFSLLSVKTEHYKCANAIFNVNEET